MWRVHRRWWVGALAIAVLGCLPFAIYVLSPGGWALMVLLLLTCAIARVRDVPDVGLTIADASVRATPPLAKFEFLAFVANLLCSMYNYHLTPQIWPHWGSVFATLSNFFGFTVDLAAIKHGMYTLGIEGVTAPDYIKTGLDPNNLAALVFALIWTVLPFIYVLYFAVLAKLAKDSPGTRIQQALCLFGIIHFLFLTDVVDYRFGRGLANPYEDLAHWIERAAWGVALLLPVYQKLATAQWLRGNGLIGVFVHYAVFAWATLFSVYHVLIYGLPRFLLWATGRELLPFDIFEASYKRTVGYFGGLVLMTLLYGFMVLFMRCKRIVFEKSTGSALQ
jgi:hypothetical protein